ncbi:ligand-binding sensor domain-containing diguanylate cyclase [Azospirillum sp. B4]|uniref:ligand-binding sensor domain-containing diguanylate cyclase n=1 Tax=Azospirillum sp. B4 TaxID=95605 RepID=UPI0019001592|nr:ligand-binding sensor domain-containing diguanylate cyclase [Azospirillum sp. B4]
MTLSVSPALAAAERWSGLADTVFQNYGRDQGLPHPVPTALAQDRDGFLWIGTQGGLARWDGYRFKSYTANPDVPGSLPSDFIKSLHVDSRGRLWVGANGLALYNAAQDRFETIPLGAINGRPDIGAIADDGAGGLWVGTEDGLRHLAPDGHTVTALRAGDPGATGLPAGRVQAALRDRMGGLWVGTVAGLAHRASAAGTLTAVPLGDGPAANVSALFQDEDGRLWVGTIRSGLFVIDRPGAAPRLVGPNATDLLGWISAIAPAGPHEIWVGLRNRSIVAIDTATMARHVIRHDRALPNSLAHDDIWAITRDSAGSVWVGGTGGLSYHPRDSGLISTIFGGASARTDSLSASDVFAIMPSQDGSSGQGRVWLGFFDGGVDVVDPLGGRVAALRPDPARPEDALPSDIVYSMAQDEAGRVYIATRRGVYRADGAATAVRRVTLSGRDPAAATMSLRFIDGQLWVGGEGDGLRAYALDGPGATPGHLVYDGPGAPAGKRLSDPTVRALLAGTAHDVWVGTRNGLNHIDLATGAVEHIPPVPGDPQALADPYVTSLLIDAKGRLWVGTFGGGLSLMTGRDAGGRPRFRHFGLAQGLPHVNVCSLQMDGAGVIWAGTDDGLARIDPETLEVRAVRRADGSALVDYFVGASATTPAGEALFGSKGGLTVVRPGLQPAWRFAAPVVVTDLRVGGQPMPAGRIYDAANPLVLSPDANSLAVEFAALDYTAPVRNRYAYRLDGYDHDWIAADVNRRLAVYTNLPPGDYTLRLRGSNRDGVWAERDLALPLRVLPAWYQHVWLRLLVAAAMVVAMTLLVRWRTGYLRRRQAELEHQIAERTADLRAANDRLLHLATTDPLTGCDNRRHFMERAREMIALANRHGTPLTLAILDLDDFKQVNDTYGHPGGDAVLALTGRVIGAHVRSTDLVGRIGGEEFALLMPHTAAYGARLLAERLRQAICDGVVETDGGPIRVTASLGLAELRKGEDLDALYVRADAALYLAKQSGRNRVEMTLPAE